MWQIVWDEEGASVDVYPDRDELSWEESCVVGGRGGDERFAFLDHN